MSTYAELQKKYNMFLAPGFKVEIDGNELPAAELGIGGIGVDLGLGSSVSACRFTVSNMFVKGTRQISTDALDSLSAGKKLKLSLGYGSSLTPVFYGYIANLGLRWSDNLTLAVTCLDVRSLMRANVLEISKETSTVKSVIEEILKRYSPLISSSDVSIAELSEKRGIMQNSDDLTFICNEASKRGIDFRLDVDKAFLKSEKAETCLTLDWDDYELNLDIGYLNTKYVVRGFDMDKQEVHEKSSEAVQQGNQEDLIQTKKEIPLDLKVSADAYDAVLGGKVKDDLRASLKGSVICAGLPEIKPGKAVVLKNSPLGKLGLKNEIAVTSVRHSMGESGFKTTFQIGGNA